jgi:hypothetical protein
MSPGGGVSVPAAAGAVAAEAVPVEAVPDEEAVAGFVTEDEPDEHATAQPAVRRRTAGAMSRRDDLPGRAAMSISPKLLNAW